MGGHHEEDHRAALVLAHHVVYRATLKTRTIAGYKISLPVGVRVLAQRPAAGGGVKEFPVSIVNVDTKAVLVTVPGLAYDAANKLLMKFNSDPFNGRVW
jgi:hypothetical protein